MKRFILIILTFSTLLLASCANKSGVQTNTTDSSKPSSSETTQDTSQALIDDLMSKIETLESKVAELSEKE